MRCPCGNSEIEPHTFREYLRNTQEARMSAHVVVKGERFGGLTMRRIRGEDGNERVQVAEDLPAPAESKQRRAFRWPWEKRVDPSPPTHPKPRPTQFDADCGC